MVDREEDGFLLVALNEYKRCPDEVSDTFWPPDCPLGIRLLLIGRNVG